MLDLSDQAGIEAAVWLARLRADDCTEDDHKAFRAWVAASDAHARAFETATMLFEYSPQLVEHYDPSPVKTGLSRRAVLAGVAGGGVIIAGTATWQQAYASIRTTEIGERRQIDIGQGAKALLDTDSSLRLNWLLGAGFTLQRGRVFCEISDAAKPFKIKAAASDILVSNAALEVRLDDHNGVTIFIASGEAQVIHDGVSRTLVANDRLTPDGRVDRPNLAAMLAWRDGLLLFDGETLETACREMNRYSRIRLVPAKDVKNSVLSGSFAAGENVAFANTVTRLLPITATQQGDIILLKAGGQIQE
ncbi:MAG: DUF4880 domain-containing protein [Sphingobium sp.]|nr:DUF4880 domain-containing protein [Sphingobium sp.]